MMKNQDLIRRLQEFPADLPIMFKVDQELTGRDDYTWMRGECTGIAVEEIFEFNDELIVDRDQMYDEVYNEPEKYGLNTEPSDKEIEAHLDAIRKIVLAVRVSP